MAGKIVCVGRNYAEHARELNNPVPKIPLLFIKPDTALADVSGAFTIPETDCHFEAEIAVRIGQTLTSVSADEATQGISGITLALDLTKRALQSELKAKGHPWELAKAFDGACPLGSFISPAALPALDQLTFTLHINDALRQQGSSGDMIMPIPELLAYVSQHFTLREGDIVLTGTPKGVGELHVGDRVTLQLCEEPVWQGTALARRRAVDHG